MAFAREIFQHIKQYIPFQRADNEKDSHYTIIGNTLVRISNHCSYMYVWDNYFEKNPKSRGMKIVSIVFEDNGDTFHPNCLVLKRDRKKPLIVEEFVYPLHGNGKYFTKEDTNTIIKSLRAIGTTNKFQEPTGKGIYQKRVSINPTSQNVSVDKYGNNVYTTENGYGADFVSESKKINTKETNENIKMSKKQTIRLNETDFHRLVKESVKRVLKEDIFDDAESDFDTLREYYYGEQGKDFLIDRLWYFIDDKPGFIKYMKTSAQFPDEDDED